MEKRLQDTCKVVLSGENAGVTGSSPVGVANHMKNNVFSHSRNLSRNSAGLLFHCCIRVTYGKTLFDSET